MNLSLWTAIREYIAAEIRLERARMGVPAQSPSNREHLAKCESESTHYEQIVRELIERPTLETCEGCKKPLPPVAEWSMPHCPDCVEKAESAVNRGPDHEI